MVRQKESTRAVLAEKMVKQQKKAKDVVSLSSVEAMYIWKYEYDTAHNT